jgi:hypothetical protein
MMNLRGYAKHYWQTLVHKYWVARYMLKLYPAISGGEGHVSWSNWLWRALRHDWTKFTADEAPYFASTIDDLGRTEYGTPEYKALLDAIRPAIDHHQQSNDHHPEYWNGWGGYNSMPLLCRHEMICDWAAAIRRGKNGSLPKSIAYNAERFGYGEDEIARLSGLGRRLVDERY